MDIAKLREIVQLMKDNDLTEVDVQEEGRSIVIRRGAQPQTVINHQPMIYGSGGGGGGGVPMPAMLPMAAAQGGGGGGGGATAPAGNAAAAAATAAAASDAGLVAIESPMVGTLYLAPNPQASAFVKQGQQVGPDTVVCLIEAMKVFNEIKAEKAGVVERVLVKNGEAVEFGQKMFMIRPT